MQHSNITATRPFENLLVLRNSKFPKILKTISNKRYVKASAANPTINPPPGHKTPGIETAIHFFDIEYGDKTEEVEEVEILVIHDSSLVLYKQNLFKRKFTYIDTFNHEVPAVVSDMFNCQLE